MLQGIRKLMKEVCYCEPILNNGNIALLPLFNSIQDSWYSNITHKSLRQGTPAIIHIDRWVSSQFINAAQPVLDVPAHSYIRHG